MNKLVLALKSRTFWTAVAIFLYFGLVGVAHVLPNVPVIDTLVGGLGFILINYFHVNPSQNYVQPTTPPQA